MTAAHRTFARIALIAAGAFVVTAALAAPAQAHGALNNPVSRVYACSPEGGQGTRSAACKAAIAVSGAETFAEWDNLRVPNVNGRDRQLIPDGKLCSGGLPAYRGLDLARADWPATKLTAGANFTFTYRTTIPHQGSFRMYVTRDGFDPTQPLKWSDLDAKPFLTVNNPKITNGAYVMPGKLPAGKTGRHIIYTIWQTTSTPDTYYSCSDAVFTAAAGGAPVVAPPKPAASAAAAAQAPVQQPSNPASQAAVAPSADLALTTASSYRAAIPVAVGGFAVLAVASIVGMILWRFRRRPA
jgi:predicted carbohydrate-binding protein with CBM5 and CBM33 domain